MQTSDEKITQVKKILIAALGSFVAIIFIFQLVSWFGTGTLQVALDEGEVATLIDHRTGNVIEEFTESAEIKLASDEYQIMVERTIDQAAQSAIVSVIARETTDYSPDLLSPIPASVVASTDKPSGKRLYILGDSFATYNFLERALYQVTPKGFELIEQRPDYVNQVGNSVQIQLGQAITNVVDDNGRITPLPFYLINHTFFKSKSVNELLSVDENGLVFVGDTSIPELLVTNPNLVSLEKKGSTILAHYPLGAVRNEEAEEAGGEGYFDARPLVFNNENKASITIEDEVTDAALNQDGSLVLYVNINGSSYAFTVADSSSTALPLASNVTIIDDDAYISFDGSSFWRCSLLDRVCNVLHTPSAITSVVNYVVKDGSVVYVTDSDDGNQVVAASGSDAVSPTNFPFRADNYRIDVAGSTNSSQPTFLITTYAILNRPEQRASFLENTRSYRQQAIRYLEQNYSGDYNLTFSPDI